MPNGTQISNPVTRYFFKMNQSSVADVAALPAEEGALATASAVVPDEAAADSGFVSAEELAPVGFAVPLPLKSVAYQPLPLS